MPELLEYQRTSLEAAGRRIDSLDLLRGIAILGIFLMNTQSMGLIGEAYINPTKGGGDSPANYLVFVVVHILADMKFITLFSLMFGAGILLQGERVAARGMSSAAVHYRRMGVLLLIGLVHAYCLWYGDILVAYACCGLLLYPLGRYLPAWSVAMCGVAMVLTAPVITWLLHENRVDFLNHLRDWAWSLYKGTNEISAYRAGGSAEWKMRAISSLDEQTRVFLTWTFWRCGGAILLGMALQRWRFFQGTWATGAYALLALLLVPTGWALSLLGIYFNHWQHWDPWTLEFPGMQFNYFGSLLTSVGYLASGVLVAMWVAQARQAPALARPLHARIAAAAVSPVRCVGRMALTNYLFQTLVGTTLFDGHGLGYFESLDRVDLLGIVAITWSVQLTGSWLWMRTFRQGPVEWLWRTLAYLGRGMNPEAPPAPPASPPA